MKYQHGSTFVCLSLCLNLCLYDIDLCCISNIYVQVLVLYHMDLRYILVSMVVYSSHGSILYSPDAMMRLHLLVIQSIDVFQIPTL